MSACVGKKTSFSGFLARELTQLIEEGSRRVLVAARAHGDLQRLEGVSPFRKGGQGSDGKVEAQAKASGLSPSYYATAVLMNHALSISKDARSAYISLFPKVANANGLQEFVEDGNRSHLPASLLGPAVSREEANYGALGKCFYGVAIGAACAAGPTCRN